jgi:hypothetical protein
MPEPFQYVPPHLRFPNRLEKVRRAGIEVARTIGQLAPKVRLIKARVEDFDVSYFTPFNQPRHWPSVDWDNRYIRLKLYGLGISSDRGTCLEVWWTNKEQWVRWFRDPTDDEWDRRFRKQWKRREEAVAKWKHN